MQSPLVPLFYCSPFLCKSVWEVIWTQSFFWGIKEYIFFECQNLALLSWTCQEKCFYPILQENIVLRQISSGIILIIIFKALSHLSNVGLTLLIGSPLLDSLLQIMQFIYTFLLQVTYDYESAKCQVPTLDFSLCTTVFQSFILQASIRWDWILPFFSESSHFWFWALFVRVGSSNVKHRSLIDIVKTSFSTISLNNCRMGSIGWTSLRILATSMVSPATAF